MTSSDGVSGATDPQIVEDGALVGRSCSTCLTGIAEGEAACICPSCRSPFHHDCWLEVGGCATYGCELMASTPDSQDDGEKRRGWGDEKTCPCCQETIKAAATKCRYCKTVFPSAAPLSESEFSAWERRQASIKPLRRKVLVLLFSSLIGLFAPVVLVVGGIWVSRSRDELLQAGGLYAVFAFFSLGISVLYLLVLVMAFL